MIRRPTPTLAALAVTLLIALPSVSKADDDNHAQDAQIAKTLGLISAEKAREIALKQAPGAVKEIELDERSFNKGWKWEVEVVNAEGREVEVYVDAKTGEVLKVKKKWF